MCSFYKHAINPQKDLSSVHSALPLELSMRLCKSRFTKSMGDEGVGIVKGIKKWGKLFFYIH